MTKPRSCFLIPIYDHGSTIEAVLTGLVEYDLPCIVVDDGSHEDTRKTLDRVEQELDWVQVHHRKENGGRGAALKTGYRLAAERGFDYAIQLDADGQHAARDVPAFLQAIERQPGALVLGSPIFDDSAPKARLYGRKLSIYTVWAATASLDVIDPLCGFRGIPLAEAVAWLDENETGDHMEFDPELVIALHWRGVAIADVPTRVVYEEGGISHFDMTQDNLRLTQMYFRSLGRAFWKVPARWWRSATSTTEQAKS